MPVQIPRPGPEDAASIQVTGCAAIAIETEDSQAQSAPPLHQPSPSTVRQHNPTHKEIYDYSADSYARLGRHALGDPSVTNHRHAADRRDHRSFSSPKGPNTIRWHTLERKGRRSTRCHLEARPRSGFGPHPCRWPILQPREPADHRYKRKHRVEVDGTATFSAPAPHPHREAVGRHARNSARVMPLALSNLKKEGAAVRRRKVILLTHLACDNSGNSS